MHSETLKLFESVGSFTLCWTKSNWYQLSHRWTFALW